MDDSFALFDCSLARCAVGRACSNLRELLDAVRTAPEAVLEHHLMRCALENHFELYEFPNDFAAWCWSGLGDHMLGEQLSLVDPYQLPSINAVRAMLIEIVEDRLWSLDRVPWCRPGLELHLVQSHLIAFDTGERAATPAALAEAIQRMPCRSLFFHVHEARRRTGGRSDDFSAWLETIEADPALVSRIRSIDFYFLNLNQLRQELVEAFRHDSEHTLTIKVTA
jgi:hypothetical protein